MYYNVYNVIYNVSTVYSAREKFFRKKKKKVISQITIFYSQNKNLNCYISKITTNKNSGIFLDTAES